MNLLGDSIFGENLNPKTNQGRTRLYIILVFTQTVFSFFIKSNCSASSLNQISQKVNFLCALAFFGYEKYSKLSHNCFKYFLIQITFFPVTRHTNKIATPPYPALVSLSLAPLSSRCPFRLYIVRYGSDY